MTQTRQLAAIMFTDIVGYTALMGEDEEKAFELLKKNRQVQKPLIQKFNGKWLKEIGDGVLASFPTVSDAIYCAGAIQKACGNDPDLKLRIGIHLGEVVFENGDVFGDGVNIASRLEPLAPAGGILVSDSVNRNLGNKKGIETEYIGEETLKNVKHPVKVYSVKVHSGFEGQVIKETQKPVTKNSKKGIIVFLIISLVLAGTYFLYSQLERSAGSSKSGSTMQDKSIAVLPFKNDSPDPENEYFCNGMLEETLNYLQKISALKVKSRTSVEQYRESTKDLHTIAGELGVAYVVEGSVRKAGDDLRITAQLINTASGDHLWSETYDGKYTDKIFDFQSEIAKKIAGSLDILINPKEREDIDRMPTSSMEAYDLYIRAGQESTMYWSTMQKEHLQRSFDLLRRSLQIDPEFLGAITGIGGAFMADEKYDSAFYYADKAIGLDPEFGGAYGLKGECYWAMGQMDLAIENYVKAMELQPNEYWWPVAAGRAYASKNDIISALPYLQKGLDADKETLVPIYTTISMAFLSAGDFEKARKYSEMAIDINLNCFAIYVFNQPSILEGKFDFAYQKTDSICKLTNCITCDVLYFKESMLLGEFDQAKNYYDKLDSSLLEDFYGGIQYEIAYVYYQLGQISEAERIFQEQIQILKAESDKLNRNTNLGLSRIYAFQGNRELALKYLKEYADHGFMAGWLEFIQFDPFFENLREDPEFKAIVKQVQEEKASIRAKIREMEESGELIL